MDLIRSPAWTTNPLKEWYIGLFNYLDRDKKGHLIWRQVEGLFMTSGLKRSVFAKIWDVVNEKRTQTLNCDRFIQCLLLISAVQQGRPISMLTIRDEEFGPPRLEWPVGYTVWDSMMGESKPSGPVTEELFTSEGEKKRSFQTGEEGEPGAKQPTFDPFKGLVDLTDLGGSSIESRAMRTGPKWDRSVDSPAISMPAVSPVIQPYETMMTVPVSHPDMPAMQSFGSVPIVPGYGHVSAAPGVLIGEGTGYSSSSALSRHSSAKEYESKKLVLQLEAAEKREEITTMKLSDMRIQCEQLRVMLDASEQRERLTKTQLNDARIKSERLEIENEKLKKEVMDALTRQSEALEQNREMMATMDPLRKDNEQLKDAISQWRDLVAELRAEIATLNAECESLQSQLIHDGEHREGMKHEHTFEEGEPGGMSAVGMIDESASEMKVTREVPPMNESEWAMSVDQKTRYQGYFAKGDSMKKGSVPHSYAAQICERSGLTNDELEPLWDLVSPRMSEYQFCVLLHLVSLVSRVKKTGRDARSVIPPRMPRCLLKEAFDEIELDDWLAERPGWEGW